MSPPSAAAADAARRLWARITGDAGVPDGIPESAEQLFADLRVGLGRWIGAEGYDTLLGRALVLARKEHPSLGSLSGLAEGQPATSAAVQKHGAGAVSVGLIALVAVLIELLGNIIGEDMAVHLVEQAGIPSLRTQVSTDRRKGRDG